VQPATTLAASADPYVATLKITGANGILLTVPLSITVSSYGISIDPPSKNFGTVTAPYTQPAAQVFTITNTSTAQITSLAATLDGTDAGSFDITADPSTTVGAGLTTTVIVQPNDDLTARAAPYTATLKITGSNGISQDVYLSFTVSSYGISIDLPSKDFGIIPIPYVQPAAQVFTIENIGTAQITSLAATLEGTDAGSFVITADPSTTLDKDATTTVSVQPATSLDARAAPYTATLKITGSNGILLTVPLSITVSSYVATVDPTSKDFGTVTASYTQPAAQVFTIKNTGTAQLTSLAATLGGADAGSFTITADPSTTLGAGLSTTVSVQPNASLAVRDTPYVATLEITGANGIALSVPLSFTVSPYGAAIDATSKDFGEAVKGYDASAFVHIFTITNTGTATLDNISYSLTGANASDFVIVSAPISSLAAGERATIEVRPVAGLGVGSYRANLVVTIPALASPLVSVLDFEVTAADTPPAESDTPSTGDLHGLLFIGIAGALCAAGIVLISRRPRFPSRRR
jgi:uncharacterized membrane protein